ncbi:MAG: metal ABC transporter permease [Firmicutes bacterium]|nr:metal ABC transporter permease [Bacillota bacterium]
MNIFEELRFYLQFTFVQYAIIVAILTAVCAALIGVPLVLKRYSFAGFALSNVAFLATAVAIVINLTNNLLFVMPLTVLASVLLIGFNSRFKLRGDATLAMLAVGTLALGYFIINTFAMHGNITADVTSSLFGATSILTLQLSDVLISLGVTILVVAFFVFFHHRIFAVTFDTEFLQATGARPFVYEILLAAIIGVVVALSMQLVGSLLTAALIIFPALSSMQLFKTFKAVTIYSSALAALCALLGVLSAIILETPVGTTIILINILAFSILYIIGQVKKKLA